MYVCLVLVPGVLSPCNADYSPSSVSFSAPSAMSIPFRQDSSTVKPFLENYLLSPPSFCWSLTDRSSTGQRF